MPEDTGLQGDGRPDDSTSIGKLDKIQQALENRPRVSIRARIAAVFAILFVLMCTVTVSAVLLLQQVRQKQVFFEKVSHFVFELQQARRFEKNFFLYGTNLQEAITNVHVARAYLRKNQSEIEAVIGGQGLQSMLSGIASYQKALEQLLDNPAPSRERKRIESALRKYGALLISDAEDTLERERQAIHSMLQTSIIVALGFLGFMVVMLVFFAGFITQAVLRPLGRFMRYADRIGSGDLSPITPARKYRDEFSSLAIAFNRMLRELLHRHEQLIQSEKMAVVGNLTSGIAHELNNPLNNIGLSVEALLDGFEEMEAGQIRHILEQVSTQVDRASGTVRNLLDFTRKEHRVFTRLDINQALQETLKLVENERRLAGVELSLQLGEDIPAVRGNPRGMEQVFLNLLLNAIQALGDGGRIEASSRCEGGRVIVEIADDGPGIAAEHLDHIFEPFFTTKDPGRGTGLGLSVSQGIVQEHGGTISVTSQPGQGTRFTISLPIAEALPGKEEGI